MTDAFSSALWRRARTSTTTDQRLAAAGRDTRFREIISAQAPSTALVEVPTNPIPKTVQVGFFPGFDGVPLRYAIWSATRSPSRGTVCIFHGRGEFIEKYFETISDLRYRGFSVATMDWRGQGASYRHLENPRKGHIVDFAEYDKDLLRFMKDVVLPDCPPPFIAIGHSMGGNILLRNAVKAGSWFDRMVLSAPMIAIEPGYMGFSTPIVRGYSETFSLAGLSHAYAHGGSDRLDRSFVHFDGNVLTSDETRWARHRDITKTGPHLVVSSPTVGWLRAALRSTAMLSRPQFARDVLVPTLIIAPARDQIVSTRASEEFGTRLKLGRAVLLPGARHEILQERDEVRDGFWAAFDAYLGVRQPGSSIADLG
ncbi:MAG: alpha/beta hydrolase [Pseudomonadota bacterium]